MIYGYARVSTAAQDETGQVRQLKAAGCEKVFRDKITGTTADRPQLQKLMKTLTLGDVVITPAVDRLSRDTTDLLVIARDMQRAGAGIRSLAEPFLDTTSDFAEIIFAILGVAAKLERRRILERTARGRADAKEKGVKFGRKPTRRTSRKRPASASPTARRSAAWLAATMSVRARFRGSRHDEDIAAVAPSPYSTPMSVGLIPRNRLKWIPKQWRLAHSFCFFLHDECVRALVEYEAARAHLVTINFESKISAEEFSRLALS